MFSAGWEVGCDIAVTPIIGEFIAPHTDYRLVGINSLDRLCDSEFV